MIPPPGGSSLLWLDYTRLPDDPSEVLRNLYVACPAGDSVPVPEKVATVDDGSTGFAGAIGPARRWVAVAVTVYGVPHNELLLFSSDSTGIWRRHTDLGRLNILGTAVSALDDTTALVVWGEWVGGAEWMRWGIARGATWTPGAAADLSSTGAVGPKLRPRPSGGQWLSWGPRGSEAGIATFKDGAWGPVQGLSCAYRYPAARHVVGFTALSLDAGEYPAVAWSSEEGGRLATICACIPTDEGFTVADDLGYTYDGFDPTVMRDVNGDVWVAWWSYAGGTYWTHSYTRATASTPRLDRATGSPRMSWTLSEPAPETWWAVLKSENGGAFHPVARVRAGPSLEMSWTENASAANLVSYRVRRECVDKRYVWESATASWPMGARPPIYLGPPTEPGAEPGGEPGVIGTPEDRRWGRVRLSLGAAEPGLVTVRVYDLQGRLALEQRVTALGTERQVIALDFRPTGQPPSSGIYFARATDAAGNASATVKVVLLR
jgi:hypothetical protein